ncbi:MAG: arsenite methyltransferase [Chloroflexi bacterium]|nr:arsenite methyltransferase [Chloroflexota bacterium]
METSKTQRIVREAYGKIAQGQGGCGCSCCGPSPREFAMAIGYSEEELTVIPEEANLALSCGNPTALASLKEGEVVLDLGSGAGFDCFLAAARVGPTGKVIGVDMTPQMLERARDTARKHGFGNVEFRLGEIENLPVADNSVDVVISNCVINLSPDKPKVFREIYRVLKPNGRIAISDVALRRELPREVRESPEAYVRCVGGAILVDEYRKIVEASGLKDVRIIVEEPSCCVESINEGLKGESVAECVANIYVEGHK